MKLKGIYKHPMSQIRLEVFSNAYSFKSVPSLLVSQSQVRMGVFVNTPRVKSDGDIQEHPRLQIRLRASKNTRLMSDLTLGAFANAPTKGGGRKVS